MDAALVPGVARPRRQVAQLHHRAGCHAVQRDDRILGIGHDLVGQHRALPGIGGMRCQRALAAAPHRLGDQAGAIHGGDVAEVVADDVGIVHADIEADAAMGTGVAPGRDHDAVVPAHGDLRHQVHVAEQAGLEHGAGQPVGRVAAEIFRGGQQRAAVRGGVDHGAAGAHGQAERLLAQHRFARREHRQHHGEMRGDVGGHVEGSDAGVGDGIIQTNVDGRPAAQQALGGIGRTRGALRAGVADRDEVDRGESRRGQGGKAKNMPLPHAAASDEADRHAHAVDSSPCGTHVSGDIRHVNWWKHRSLIRCYR